jgi:hypothetical protein
MMTVAISRVTRGAALALGLVTPVGPPPPGSPSAASPETPHLWVLRADPQSAAAPYVGFIGDSTGSQLAIGLADGLHHRDVGVVVATVGGCQPTDVRFTFQNPEYLRSHPDCTRDAPELQREMTARYFPEVVIWSDVMEWSDIQDENGRDVVAGTDEWRRRIMEGWDRLLARLGDPHVALILPNWWAGSAPDSPSVFSVERQRALFRSWAERHADLVTVVDLKPVVCPDGPPCGQTVGGVQVRSDHVHYTPEGARLAAKKIMNDVTELRTLHGPASTAS